jgi:hypothetical protein
MQSNNQQESNISINQQELGGVDLIDSAGDPAEPANTDNFSNDNTADNIGASTLKLQIRAAIQNTF